MFTVEKKEALKNLNEVDKQYHQYLINVLASETSNFRPAARTRASTIGTFAQRMIFNVGEYFPLVSTKSVAKKAMTGELIMFLRGEDNIKFLVDRNIKIWNGNGFDHYRKKLPEGDPLKTLQKDTKEFDEAQAAYIYKIKTDETFAKKNGSLDRIYGVQWRSWRGPDGKEIDQLGNAMNLIENNMYSRYALVNAWNPGENSKMALPPCHMFFQFYPRINDNGEKTLDMLMYQRSCDSLLGVPFNSGSEGLKLEAVAKQTGCKPGYLVHDLGDAHIYCGVGERADWYENNFVDIKKMVREAETPNEFRTIKNYILENATPEPEGSQGSDHIPFVLEQLARQEYHSLPQVELANKTVNDLDINDVTFIDYKPAKKLIINGVEARMAV